MITTLIYSAIEELNNYKHNKESLMPMYIEQRLNKCLLTYQREITNSIRFLTLKESRKALKEELNEC